MSEQPITTRTTDRKTVLVSGATGSVGSRLVGLVAERDADVRALVRRPAGVRVLAENPRIQPVFGDFSDPASLERALIGVDAVFLACGNVPDQIAYESALIDAAAGAGVRRLVKLSARRAAADASVAFWRWHAEIEDRLLGSGVPWVILRPGFSMANLFAAAEPVRGGLLVAPAGGAEIAMIDPVDVASVAAEALLGQDRHLGRRYTITGPEAIDYERVAAELSLVAGRDVRFVDVPPETAVSAMTGAGLPPFVAEQIAAIFRALRGGAQASITDTVAELTGRGPRTFWEFAAEVAPTFRADQRDAEPARHG
jgi:uncharacterized protein YbjT (DUF2867 family)